MLCRVISNDTIKAITPAVVSVFVLSMRPARLPFRLSAALGTVRVVYVRHGLGEPVRVLGAPEESAGRRRRARSGRAKEEPT